MLTGYDSDSDSQPSSTCSSLDEDEVNHRITPCWAKYRQVLESRGYRLDTCRDVKEFYLRYCEDLSVPQFDPHRQTPGYPRACGGHDDNALCRDAGLPDNLFRGSRTWDKAKIVVKAVHLHSREFDIIRYLSMPPLRNDPMNHCIPVLDLIEVPQDTLGLIVMDEWSPQLMSDSPYSLEQFLGAIRQCIEHTVFMHRCHIAHLDISIRNVLTDYQGHYACIDYELSRRYDAIRHPRIHGRRGTEIPPELEQDICSDPYKVDVWALAVLILRACKLANYHVPELMHLTKPMLHDDPDHRPSAGQVLKAFNRFVSVMGEDRLKTYT